MIKNPTKSKVAGAAVGCFPAGSMVTTPVGLVPIEQIKEGDIVYGFNEELLEKPVSKTFKHIGSYDNILKIDHSTGSLVVTGNHNILTNGKYVQADDLQVGDSIVTGEGQESVITDINQSPNQSIVYNIDVEDVHNYVVSDIRVHSQ